MKKLKLLRLLIVSLFILGYGCEKETFNYSENLEEEVDLISEQGFSEKDNAKYIFQGKLISENEIDFNNDNLRLVNYGKNIYVFYTEDEMYKWAISRGELAKFAQSILNIRKARDYAVRIGEVNRTEPSDDFQNWLKDNFGKEQTRGGAMYDNYYLQDYLTVMHPFPVPKISKDYNNKMTSFYHFGSSYTIFKDSYWRGARQTYIGISPIGTQRNLTTYMNNSITSYWAF